MKDISNLFKLIDHTMVRYNYINHFQIIFDRKHNKDQIVRDYISKYVKNFFNTNQLVSEIDSFGFRNELYLKFVGQTSRVGPPETHEMRAYVEELFINKQIE